MRASDNDIFVTCDANDDEGNIRHCSRLKHVNDAIVEGKNIKIISFDKLLKILNVTKEELSTMPFPNACCFYKKPKPRQRRKGYAKEALRIVLNLYKNKYDEILITCEKENIASNKTILANGGILINQIEKFGLNINRYKISK